MTVAVGAGAQHRAPQSSPATPDTRVPPALTEPAHSNVGSENGYDAVGSTVTQGALFRLEAVVAMVVAVAMLLSHNRLVWASAGLTGLAGVAAVVPYRYVDVGALTIPNRYEPVWFSQKTHSALAEGGLASPGWSVKACGSGEPQRPQRPLAAGQI